MTFASSVLLQSTAPLLPQALRAPLAPYLGLPQATQAPKYLAVRFGRFTDNHNF